MGLDVGNKRIGVAISDGLGLTAQGLGVITRRSRRADTAELLALIEPYDVWRVVAGLPLTLEGDEGEQADRVRHFCRRLTEDTGLPVTLRDERFTTVESERLLVEAGVRRRRRRDVRDKMAAVIILQGYLDSAPEPLPES